MQLQQEDLVTISRVRCREFFTCLTFYLFHEAKNIEQESRVLLSELSTMHDNQLVLTKYPNDTARNFSAKPAMLSSTKPYKKIGWRMARGNQYWRAAQKTDT